MNSKFPKNPYPGLRPFEFAENHLFFGREGQSEEVLRRLHQNRFVAVVGTSGSGKSSLVRAGLLPLLYGGLMAQAGAHWRIAVFRPGDNPIHNLSVALVKPEEFAASNIGKNKELSDTEQTKSVVAETVLRRSAVGLREYAKSAEFAPDENLLIVVDQFEELFRFKKEKSGDGGETARFAVQEKAENEAAAFVKLLLEATSREIPGRVYVVITMRSDFLGDCSQFRNLPEKINDGQYLIPRLTRDQLRRAVESPAKVRRAQNSPELTARLLNDIGEDQDQLPVLQHTLMRTWDEWARRNTPASPIEFADYDRIGAMARALSEHADEAFFGLGGDDPAEKTKKQKIAEKLFKCLTETDRENREIRRATALGKICRIAAAEISEVVSVIDVFRADGRTFLMPPAAELLDENSPIDISHESLIRKWDRLREWVADEAKSSQQYRRLADDALLHGAGGVGLWSDPELKIGRAWRVNARPNSAWAELYHKSWGAQYQNAFAAATVFLHDSKLNQKRQLKDAERQRNRELEQERMLREVEREKAQVLESTARRLRKYVLALAARSLLMLLTTGFAVYYAFAAQQNAAKAAESQQNALRKQADAETSAKRATESEEETKKAKIIVEGQKEEAERQKKEIEKQKETAVEQKKRADEQAQQARQKEAEKQAALSQQERLTAQAKVAKTAANRQTEIARNAEIEAYKARDEATKAQMRAENAVNREKLNHDGLVSLEKSQFRTARTQFEELSGKYDDELDAGVKKEGKWWALHNLGNINGILQNYDAAEQNYKEALTTLGEPAAFFNNLLSENSPQYFFQSISYQLENSELDRSKIATFLRLARISRTRAKAADDLKIAVGYNNWAAKYYNRLLVLLKANLDIKEDNRYLAEMKTELADTQFDLNDNKQAAQTYGEAFSLLNENRSQNLNAIIAVETKLSKIETRRKNFEIAKTIVKHIIKVQTEELGAAPFSAELADGYSDLSDVYFAQDESEKQQKAENNLNQPKTPDAKQENGQAQSTESKQSQSAPQTNLPPSDAQIKAQNYAELSRLIKQWNEKTKIKTKSNYEYNNLMNAYIRAGDCKKAENVYLAGLKAGENIVEPTFNPYFNKLSGLAQRASFYVYSLRDEETSEKYYREFAAEVRKPNFEAELGLLTTEQKNRYLYELGYTAYYLKRFNEYEAARIILRHYLELLKFYANASQPVQFNPSRFNAELDLAEINRKIGNLDEAKANYLSVSAYLKSIPQNINQPGTIYYPRTEVEMNILFGQAKIARKQNDNSTARNLFEQIKTRSEKYLTESAGKPTANGDTSSIYLNYRYSLALFEIGDIERDSGGKNSAAAYYEKAAAALNRLISNTGDDGQGNYYNGYYDEIIENYEILSEMLEAWAGVVDGENRVRRLNEAKTTREKIERLKLTKQSKKVELCNSSE